MKKCSRCGEEKTKDGFHRNTHQRDGLATYCKPCHIKRCAEKRIARAAKLGFVVCSSCRQQLPPEKFTLNRHCAPSIYCKPCRVIKETERRTKKVAEFGSVSDYRRTHPKYAFSRLVAAARRRAGSVAINASDLERIFNEQKGICPLTGVKMNLTQSAAFSNLSLDRKRSSDGYTVDNVRLVTWWANMARNTMTDEELVVWCNRVVENQK